MIIIIEVPAKKEPKGKAVLRLALPKIINPIPVKAAVQTESIIETNPKG